MLNISTPKLLNVGTDEEVTYKIVGDDESDIKIGKISVYSPLARALVGKSVDDVVVVKAPNGDKEYEICSIEHI
jgi:transcription elongation factor GreA